MTRSATCRHPRQTSATCTTRLPSGRRTAVSSAIGPCPPSFSTNLRRGAERETAKIFAIRSDEDRVTVGALSQRADALQYADPAYRSELRAWTSDDPTRRDGVPALAFCHVAAGSGERDPDP